MLWGLGYKYTIAPYTNQQFWKSLKQQVNAGLQESNWILDRAYLQCYDGGAGNESAGEGRWRRHVEELECDNEDLRVKIDELEELVTRGNDEKEDLVDAVETLKLELEDVQRRREAESHERSHAGSLGRRCHADKSTC